MRNEKFDQFILDMYNLFNSKYYRMELKTPFGTVEQPTFIGRVYIGNSSPNFSEIKNMDEFLKAYPTGADMLFLNNSAEHNSLQIYEYDYRSHSIDNDELKIEKPNSNFIRLKLK
jgi:hypothetical protein